MSQNSPSSIDMLITGGLVVTMDDNWTLILDGAIAIHEGSILQVGSSADLGHRYQPETTIDAAGHAITPGLINCHTHAPMTLFRGLADDLPLEVWLRLHIWPAEAWAVKPDMVYWGGLLAAAEMIHSGTTLFTDMYFFEDDIGRAAKKAGIRAVLGEALVDFPSPNSKTPDDGLAYTEELLIKWAGDPLVKVSVQPHAPYSASADLLVRSKELANRYGAIYLTHVAETASEVKGHLEKTGLTPPAYLDKLNVLDNNTVFAHGVHLSDEDIDLLAERGTGIAHCPQSNLKLASGTARLPKLLSSGVRLGLGTDGAASNNDLNMWGEISSTAMLQKLVSNDPTTADARTVFRMATRGGAAILGLGDRLGSLEPGKRADLLLIDLEQPHLVPMYDIYSHLAYAIGKADVTTVIIEGNVVMRDRQLTKVEEAELLYHARKFAGEIGPRFAAHKLENS
ncbi:MAG: amidohydrolase [Anaerolineales bacterium]|nr:amidohydrolase [Anaerolineales bacterium]